MIYFFYGIDKEFVDVTADVLARCRYGDRVHIPAGDSGDHFFADPLPGEAKSILVVRPDGDLLSAALYGPNARASSTTSRTW